MKEKLKYAGIRALYTLGETTIATIPATAKILEDVDWWIVISSSLLASLISFIKSMLVGMPELELQKNNKKN